MMRLICFQLTRSLDLDLQREAMQVNHPDLANLVDDIMPFTSDKLYDTVPIVDDDDLRQWNMYSE